MSHTWEYGSFRVTGNSDFSGIMTLSIPKHVPAGKSPERIEIDIPGAHLKQMAGDMLSTVLVSVLERHDLFALLEQL